MRDVTWGWLVPVLLMIALILVEILGCEDRKIIKEALETKPSDVMKEVRKLHGVMEERHREREQIFEELRRKGLID